MYEITEEQYNLLMQTITKNNIRKTNQKKHVKKYHQTEKGKLARAKAQAKWRAKRREARRLAAAIE